MNMGSVQRPGIVMAACLLWIIAGSIGLLVCIQGIITTSILVSAAPSVDDSLKGFVLGVIAFSILINIAFIGTGASMIRGKSKYVASNAVISILFGLAGALYLSGDTTLANIVNFFAGMCFLVAGILALVGRKSYFEWRQALAVPPKE